MPPLGRKGGGFFMVETNTYQENTKHSEVSYLEESLFNHYSIDNEVEFLRKIEHLSQEEKRFYIRENMLGFLGEYAGKIPYKKITYLQKNGGFDFAGIDMNSMYRSLLEEVAVGSREWYETQGMLNVQEEFSSGLSNTATVFSPPKQADYSFAFHFEKGSYDGNLSGVPITEYILRYPEHVNSIKNTKHIARSISSENVDEVFTSAHDFLKTPFYSLTSHKETEIARLLNLVGIDNDTIQTSKQYEQIIRNDLMPWIDRYFDYVSELSRSSTSTYQTTKEQTEHLLGALYNRARFIKEALDTSLLTQDDSNFLNRSLQLFQEDTYSENHIKFFAQSKPLTVTGGSCPVTKKTDGLFGNSFLSIGDIHSQLLEGNTLSSIVDKEPFECPRCHFKTHKSVGDQCPSCKLTKNEAAKEGFTTC
jgi:hypothetical protein